MGVDHEQGVTQRLTEPEDIYRVLKLLELHRALITVTLPGQKQMASSMVLDVNLENQTLTIDQLNDTSLQNALSPQSLLVFRAAYGGVQVSGECQLQRIQTDDKGAKLLMALPGKVLHRQRRAAFRANITGETPAISLSGRSRETLEGWITDVSAEGLGVVFDKFIHPPIEPGEVFERCEFVANGRQFTQALMAKHPSYDKFTDKYRCGFSFYRLNAAEAKQVNQWVIQLQRTQRQHLRLSTPRS
ncbi:flagellar brake protein [Simiduia sp. 21SJ11W-1]|uniref:flagellar brake protein n=1 Tax=Simiduia sp. 21SJ11W-1 TaxID=2909669 RepID=UPI00209FA19D|nr:flagellar brake protein [Simiduia sp. 21SJ11W-1]UTA49453.1 flagellar brake protein [Simiduia sp. 21SJ11W-1]